MSEAASYALIGFGGVNKAFHEIVTRPGAPEMYGLEPEPRMIIKSTGAYEADGVTPSKDFADLSKLSDEELPDLAVVAINSYADGIVAQGHIERYLDADKRVVTAEKGYLANFFERGRDKSEGFKRLGASATVGGGTLAVNFARLHIPEPKDVTQIHMVPNGTLQFMLGRIGPNNGSQGVTLGAAADEALRLGYAEPEATGPIDIMLGEASGDVPKKTSIFFNMLGLDDEILHWQDIGGDWLYTEDHISRVAHKEAQYRRMIVSFYSHKFFSETVERNQKPDDTIGGFSISHGGWQIVGGFQRTDANPLFPALADLSGPGNAVVIGKGEGEAYGAPMLRGEGAGPAPTAYSMLTDWLQMRKER